VISLDADRPTAVCSLPVAGPPEQRTMTLPGATPAASERAEDTLISWPKLNEVGLTRHEIDARLLGIGGSDANIILSGDRERITRLWLEKRGAPAEDLSDRSKSRSGSWTEAFNRQWYEKITGQAVQPADGALVCSQHPWRRCTLDGFIAAQECRVGGQAHQRVRQARGRARTLHAPAAAQHGRRQGRARDPVGHLRQPQVRDLRGLLGLALPA
jgi:hypothetical protein